MGINGTIQIDSSQFAPASRETNISTRADKVYGFILLSSIAVNFFVIWAVVVHLKQIQMQRTVKLLIANLALVCGLSSVTAMFSSGIAPSIFHMEEYSCKILIFVTHVTLSSFSNSVIGIFVERIRAFGEHTDGQLNVIACIFNSWVWPMIVNIPILFSDSYETAAVGDHRVGHRRNVLLLDSIVFTIIYHVGTLLLYHTIPLCVIFPAITSIRRKVQYLLVISPVPDDSLRRKIRSTRMLTYFKVTFVFVWLPVGLVKCYDMTHSGLIISWISSLPSKSSTTFWIAIFTLRTYFAITPLICYAIVSRSFTTKLFNALCCLVLGLVRLWNNLIESIRCNEESSERSSQLGDMESSFHTIVEEFAMDHCNQASTLTSSGVRASGEDVVAGCDGYRQACMSLPILETTEAIWV